MGLANSKKGLGGTLCCFAALIERLKDYEAIMSVLLRLVRDLTL